jgi:two-component system, OmpR family, sensor kinase
MIPRSVRCYLGKSLHRRLFAYFGAAILLSGLTAIIVVKVLGGENPWRRQQERAALFVAGRFERVWDDPKARDDLARALSQDMELEILVTDAAARPVAAYGELCYGELMIPVWRGGELLGFVLIDGYHPTSGGAWNLALMLIAAGGVLWALAGKVARRFARPLSELTRVAEEIGEGRLSARARLNRRATGEVGVLAEALNRMADRIERQMGDQRELLAAVSHELRTPLSRVRLLTEIARDRGIDPKLLDDIDGEVVEIDSLVGDLLAKSRLDFASLSRQRIDAAQAARRALDRAGLDAALFVEERPLLSFEGDPTLIARALANLIENARRYGGGLKALRVTARGGRVAFEADDAGPGFLNGDAERAFDSFYRGETTNGKDAGGIGLGLALVKRIAEAHGGQAFAQNRPEGGARVGIEVAVTPPGW